MRAIFSCDNKGAGRVRASRGLLAALGCTVLLAAGCFSEQSFPLREGDVTRLGAAVEQTPTTTREWLVSVKPQIRRLMPRPERPILTTEEMLDADGRGIDVFSAFNRQSHRMDKLLGNWWAIQHTAQSIEIGYFIETPAPLWPDFEHVWIPVDAGVSLSGYLGLARDESGRPIDADCIVILPGLWGDNGAKRSRDVSEGLRRQGFHVLSLEPRGHGQTEARYPEVMYTYGVVETRDLMRVSEWLQDTYSSIRRTGLVGFCWGANQALLAAWYDGRDDDDPSVSPRLRAILGPPSPREHFSAGVIAFSPVLNWEHFLDRMDRPKSMWNDPSPAAFQTSTKEHMARKQFREVTGSLRLCIAYDFTESAFGRTFPLAEGYTFLRLLPYRGLWDGDKLERARMPVLVVHSVNDPLQTAPEVVELMAQTSNPNVAGLMLPGGGHIGFQAWSRPLFYSLMVSFFDPQTGPAAIRQRSTGSAARSAG